MIGLHTMRRSPFCIFVNLHNLLMYADPRRFWLVWTFAKKNRDYKENIRNRKQVGKGPRGFASRGSTKVLTKSYCDAVWNSHCFESSSFSPCSFIIRGHTRRGCPDGLGTNRTRSTVTMGRLHCSVPTWQCSVPTWQYTTADTQADAIGVKDLLFNKILYFKLSSRLCTNSCQNWGWS